MVSGGGGNNWESLPQQLPLAKDGIVDRVQGLEVDLEVFDPHVGQLLCVRLLDSSHHRLPGRAGREVTPTMSKSYKSRTAPTGCVFQTPSRPA